MSIELGRIIVKCKTCHENENDPDCKICQKLLEKINRAWNFTNAVDTLVKSYIDSTVKVYTTEGDK